MRVPNKAVDALLEQYRVHAPGSGERFAQHAGVSGETPLRILFLDDPLLGRYLLLASNEHRWIRPCPLSENDAAGLVSETREDGALDHSAQELSTLAELLIRCSRLFASENLRRLRLAPVYLGTDDYRVGSASMTRSGAILSP